MSFITVEMIKSLVTEDMIRELISDSVIEKIFTDDRVKSHIEKLVKEVMLDMSEKGMIIKEKINGPGTRLRGRT